MAFPDVGVSASPTSAGAGRGSRTLDTPPPMPPRQRRPSSVLFTPPMDDDNGLNAMGGDPMVQTMAATKAVDMAFQKLATLYPDAIDPLAQLQMSFRQLITGLMSMQEGNMNAPGIVPPLPMQSGSDPGLQQGPQL